jgi:hypothetical protein
MTLLLIVCPECGHWWPAPPVSCYSSADDPMITFELTDQVRETIQQTLYQLLTQRRNMFLG